MKRYFLAIVLPVCGLYGCATVPLGSHQPSVAVATELRDSGIAALNVGAFTRGGSLSASGDRQVTVRGNPVKPADGRSFANFLRDSLTADLKASGKFDTSSSLTVSGELLVNELHAAGISTASAVIEARFRVARGAQNVFDKQLRSESSWESSFIGVVAYQNALNGYTETYSSLLAKLYADPDFRKACTPQ
jgi:hypothetical protein